MSKQQRGGVKVGSPAPDFELKDSKGDSWRLSEHRGKVIALVFYPKDETAVCTKQMCSMRDRWQDYEKTGAEVVGVSVGSVDQHRSFADHHGLPQTLLADEKGELTQLYGLKSIFGDFSQRAVVVVDRDGIIRYRKSTFPIFRPSDDEVINAIRKTQNAGN